MSYFDSPKNRALWSKELEALKKQKERRAQGLDEKANVIQSEAEQPAAMSYNSSNVMRERTSYKELLREESMEIKSRRTAAGVAKQAQKAMESEMSSPALGR